MKTQYRATLSLLVLAGILLAQCSVASVASAAPTTQDFPAADVVQPTDNLDSLDVVSAAATSDDGYILIAPINSTETYLIDRDGQIVHTWSGTSRPGNSVYLLDNGDLLRTTSSAGSNISAGGAGGGVERYSWEGDLLWSFNYATNAVLLHHDIELMPNGNILMIAWETISLQDAFAAGMDASLIADDVTEVWFDHVIEVNPDTNEIVWEWHVFDHLVQDADASRDNYGVVVDAPGLIDVNANAVRTSDLQHINSIDYNPELDQILLSARSYNEVWIIDHDTTTQQAAGVAGDLLYRWGNPQVYDQGSANDQQLYAQHDAQWILEGLDGAGELLIFNNGDPRARSYSSITQIDPGVQPDGSYALTAGAFSPAVPSWEYTADIPADFFADHISGMQRLANGNTLICAGTSGEIFEVTPTGETVWYYQLPGEGTSIFRAELYTANSFALAGRTLIAQGEVPASSAPGGAGAGGQGGPGSGQSGNQPGGQLDYASAAATLGISETDLRAVLSTSNGGRPDLQTAATTLGVSAQALAEALGLPARNGGPGNGSGGNNGGPGPSP